MSQKLTVVLIEDERNITNFIQSILINESYKVLTASTGKDGLSLIASQCPDMILLDLGLPDIDGIQVIEKIRTFTKTPIIVISARIQEEE